ASGRARDGLGQGADAVRREQRLARRTVDGYARGAARERSLGGDDARLPRRGRGGGGERDDDAGGDGAQQRTDVHGALRGWIDRWGRAAARPLRTIIAGCAAGGDRPPRLPIVATPSVVK